MKRLAEVPSIADLKKFYNPGFISRLLHFQYDNEQIIPWDAYKNQPPELSLTDNTSGESRAPRSAFERYKERLLTRNQTNTPLIVSVDSDISLEKLVWKMTRNNWGDIKLMIKLEPDPD